MSYTGFEAMLMEKRAAIAMRTLNPPPIYSIGPALREEVHQFPKDADAAPQIQVIDLARTSQ